MRNPRFSLLVGNAADTQAKRRFNAFFNGEQIECDAELRNITDFMWSEILLIQVPAAPVDRAFVRLPDSRDHLEQRAFSATGRAHHGMQSSLGKSGLDPSQKPAFLL